MCQGKAVIFLVNQLFIGLSSPLLSLQVHLK